MDYIRLGILEMPLVFAAVILAMSILDELLSRISRALYLRGHNRFFAYAGMGRAPQLSNHIVRWIIKIGIAAMIVLIYWAAKQSDMPETMALYQGFAGFAFFNYLIINIRHIENILIYRLTAVHRENFGYSDLEGELVIGRRFSLRQSSFQIFAVVLLLFGVLIFHPTYFMLGGMLAPLFISVRNMILSNTVRTA